VTAEKKNHDPIALASKAEPPPPTGLELLRQPFPAHQVSKLPKGTKAQNDCAPNLKRRCEVCGGWHHPDVIHLDYVGHAAMTDRLLDADPAWNWEPVAFSETGLPAFDATGGLWIRLTVRGVTRLGYGNAAGKSYMDVGSREKECIGDALRNAAMRFGAALDLWHKGTLHAVEAVETGETDKTDTKPRKYGDTEPAKGSARGVTEDAFNALDSAEKEGMQRKAQSIADAYAAKGLGAAVDVLHELKLDTEGKLAIWFCLDSELRSSIKREEIRRREAAPTTTAEEF
jgi:hypothetical protein